MSKALVNFQFNKLTSLTFKNITPALLVIFAATGCSPALQKISEETKQNNQSESSSKANAVVAVSDEERAAQLATRLGTVETDIEKIIVQMTLEEKISLLHASGKFHINAIERLGIPEMWLSDGPHGVRHQIERDSWDSAGWDDDHATYLPHLTSVAASWDRNMAALHGEVLGKEARHREKDFILGPGVNLARLPLYGRNFEYMGEDPILAAKLVVPQIKAIQAQDVAATVKHYALNTQELNRTGVNAKPDERTLREVYLPAFEASVKEANVLGMMGAYNEYYGTNANQSEHLVKNILKEEWGFQGVLLTDWNVDINTYDAAMNGLDLEMGTDVASYDDYFLAKPLLKMVQDGKVPEAIVDDKVRRILRVQYSIGMQDENRLPGERNTKAHQQAAKDIAAAGVILLKNEGSVLPFTQSALKNVLVLGPNADKKHGTGGGSSEVKSLYEVTPLEGLRDKLGDDVNIEVMRARSSVLSPIASDYVASRHWTGTPAWNISFYESAGREKLLNESWIVDSQFSPENTNDEQFITMKATIKPLKTGEHTLQLEHQGAFELIIDGTSVLNTADKANETDGSTSNQAKVSLSHESTYEFEIKYDGSKGFTLGWNAPGNLFAEESEYIAAAKKADAVIYFGGLSHGDDRESIDRTHMKLPNSQDEIINKLLAANKNTVVFIVAGSAVEMPWTEKANAVVWGWYGGMEAGNAFADVLMGDINPSGKLPITLPKKLEDTAPIALNDYNEVESLYTEGVFIGYRWFEQQNIKPLFAFGHGLSYTTFKIENLDIQERVYDGNGELTLTASVTNTGTRSGSEVVQLYLSDTQASVERPAKELKNFVKVELNAGETKQVSMTLNKRDLSFWSEDKNDWLAEEGEFVIHLGHALDNIAVSKAFNYQP